MMEERRSLYSLILLKLGGLLIRIKSILGISHVIIIRFIDKLKDIKGIAYGKVS